MHLPPPQPTHTFSHLALPKDALHLLLTIQQHAIPPRRTLKPPTGGLVEFVYTVLPPSVRHDDRYIPASRESFEVAGADRRRGQEEVKVLILFGGGG